MTEQLIISTDEQEVSQGANPDKGVSFDSNSRRPVLLFKGIENDILTDGFMMLIGHGSADYIKDYVNSKKGVTAIKKGMFFQKREDAEKYIKEELKNPTGTFPDVSRLIPSEESWTGELVPVGSEYSPEQDHRVIYLTDGLHVVAVNADAYAFLRSKLPDSTVYGQREYVSRGLDKPVYLDKLNPESPLSFVSGGKVAGVLMPFKVESIPPEIKQKAASVGITTKALNNKISAWNAGTIDIDDQHGAVELMSYVTRMHSRNGDPIYTGPESEYQNQGEFYIKVASKDFPEDRVMAWNDTSMAGSPDRFISHDVVRHGEAMMRSSDLESIHESRSPQSRESDERQSNATTISPDDPRVERWKRNPGSMDVEGIDTPQPKYKVTRSKPKSRKRKPDSGLGTIR